jgi:hypothetical protein
MNTAAEMAWARWNAAATARRQPPQPTEPTDDRSARPGQRPGAITAETVPARDVDPLMAGFILWLAQHPLSADQRHRYHLAAQQFRCWHTGQRHWPTEPGHDPGRHDMARHDIAHGQRPRSHGRRLE